MYHIFVAEPFKMCMVWICYRTLYTVYYTYVMIKIRGVNISTKLVLEKSFEVREENKIILEKQVNL